MHINLAFIKNKLNALILNITYIKISSNHMINNLINKINNQTDKLENELDYQVSWKVLDSVNFGVPQSRKRVFIVGIYINYDELHLALAILRPGDSRSRLEGG